MSGAERIYTRRQTAGWVGVTAISQGVRVLTTLFSAAVLGRLLLPTDFGLIATAAPILAIVAMLQNLGLNEALIQQPDLRKEHVNALFYLMVVVSGVFAIGLYLIAPLLAGAFSEIRLTGIIRAMAGLALLTAFVMVPMTLMNRKLQFRRLAVIEIVSSIAGLVASIAVAAPTRSYWALVLNPVMTALVQIGMAFSWSDWRPGRARFDPAMRRMIGLGAGFSTFNMLNFFSRNADNLLIAGRYGATALGFYDRAYKLMLFPLWQAINPFGRVLTPVLARLRHDPVAYRERYLEATGLLMVAVQPGILAATVFSGPAVIVILGPQWPQSAPIFFWLGLTALHQIYTQTFPWLFISQGRASAFAALGAFGAVIAVASFLIGLPDGPLGVARAYAIGDLCLRTPLAVWAVGRKGEFHMGDLLKHLAPHIIALSGATAAMLVLASVGPSSNIVALAQAITLSYVVYAALLGLFPEKRRLARVFIGGLRRRLASRRLSADPAA